MFTCNLLLFTLPATLSSFEVLDIGQHKVVNFRNSLVGRAKICGIIATLIKLQLASVFVCFHSLLSVHLLNFSARSCKILQIRGFLGKNLSKIVTKKSRNIQDSYQKLQEFLHWEYIESIFSMVINKHSRMKYCNFFRTTSFLQNYNFCKIISIHNKFKRKYREK